MPEQLLPFLLVAVVLTVAPGPDTALGIRNSLRGGSTAVWWTGLGVCSGIFVHAAASVIGLSAIVAASANAYAFVKIAGATYLFWLGAVTLWRTWHDRGAKDVHEMVHDQLFSDRITRRNAFRQGFVSDLLNPKIALVFLTLLPQFISPGEPRALTSAVLTITFVSGRTGVVARHLLARRSAPRAADAEEDPNWRGGSHRHRDGRPRRSGRSRVADAFLANFSPPADQHRPSGDTPGVGSPAASSHNSPANRNGAPGGPCSAGGVGEDCFSSAARSASRTDRPLRRARARRRGRPPVPTEGP